MGRFANWGSENFMNWHRLDRDKTVEMINTVKSATEALLFSPMTSEAKCARLPFYSNYLIYRLTNFASLPTFSMDFVGDGQSFTYLDGSNLPIGRVNELGGLNLTRDTVIPYLNFYFLNVRMEEGEIIILKNPEEAATIDIYDDDRRENISLQPDSARIDIEPTAGLFIVTTPIFLDGGLVDAQITVDAKGNVAVKALGIMTPTWLQ